MSIVGDTDFRGAVNNAFRGPAWSEPSIMATGYAFAALFSYVPCYGMARYAAYVEGTLDKGRKL